MTETVQLIDTLFWNTRLFGYILNVLDIIRKMGFQYYFPHRTFHPGALHLTIKLPDEQSCPPPLAFFCKLRGTLPESLKCPRPRSSLRVPLAKLFAIGIRLYRRLIRRMFPNNLLHPDHIIPPVELIPAVLKSPAKPEPKMLMELGTVLI